MSITSFLPNSQKSNKKEQPELLFSDMNEIIDLDLYAYGMYRYLYREL